MLSGALVIAGLGILIYLLHKLRVTTIQDYKAKYDYINQYEIKTYKRVFLCFAIAAAMVINLYGMSKLKTVEVWFFVRLFMSIAGGTLIAYVAALVLDYYYPTVLNKKLRKWRYLSRPSKAGGKMRLLSEDEEDVHLEEGMQAEENVFSIDYDVWLDESSGEIRIDKYPGHLQALKCNSCGFYTMRVVKEEITRHPSKDANGELIKHFQCSYCKSVRATAYNISTKEAGDYKAATEHSFRKNKNIDLVRVEIHSNVAGKKFFDFSNIEQAQKFLEEYDAEKVS
ncbi:hypothetical protein DQQ10_26660 [Pseudochryseolinea flava]|uniref:Uncharacterized protein n=2 Tax=Pseudochryseolinea flava TaxID=2059302 RepID=A0A364XUQ7_9BACT|nr:hypothetical protein DQQ10_26660 [Pseudochryseolinea flava]